MSEPDRYADGSRMTRDPETLTRNQLLARIARLEAELAHVGRDREKWRSLAEERGRKIDRLMGKR